MIKIEFTDGGPAHPIKVEMKAGDTLRIGGKSVTLEEGHTEVFQGISKREYFAAAATDDDVDAVLMENLEGPIRNRVQARFEHADRMLAESDKKV